MLQAQNKTVLFITSCFDTQMNPVSNIIQRLIPAFQEQGYSVDVACFKSAPDEPCEKQLGKVRLYKCFSPEYVHRRQIKGLAGFSQKIIHKFLKKSNLVFLNGFTSSDMAKMLRKLYSQNDYYAIIPVCGRYEIYDAVRKSKPSAPVYLYQCDPLAGNKTHHKSTENRRRKYEKKMFAACKTVFTTPVIYATAKDDYPNVKFVPLEFPNIRQLEVDRSVTVPNVCLFGGLFYPTIRQPHYIMQLFGLMEEAGIKLHIAGGGMETVVNQYCQKYSNITLLGSLKAEAFHHEMERAAVLVNIGNTSDQVPSKIFDYMCLGKPILNICQRRDCSTLPYLNLYPLCLSVFTDEPPQTQVEKVIRFVQSCAEQYVPYSEVAERFSQCTVEFVAKRILSELK